jgi:site-specific recombinase XerD
MIIMTEFQTKILEEYMCDLNRRVKSIHNKGHRSAIGIFFRYANERGIDILRIRISEAQDFQLYLATRSRDDGGIYYSRVSVASIIERVTRFYEYLRERRMIRSNPFAEVIRIKLKKSLPRNILPEEDMSVFLKHLREFWKAGNLNDRRRLYRAHVISEFMYSTGARINEVVKIKGSDIDFFRNTARVTDDKTRKTRECILNDYAGKVLRLYIDNTRGIILTRKNNRKDDNLFGAGGSLIIWLNDVLNKESARLKLGPFTSHNFRHAVGYHLLKAGCDIRYIKEILGHEELGTTQIYTKVDKEDLKNIIDEYHPRRLRREII